MSEIHMGQLLEKAIRRKGFNITEIAVALNITRRTLYKWFKLEAIDEVTMQRISKIIGYDPLIKANKPTVVSGNQTLVAKDEAYWQDKYLNLLERYSELLAKNGKRRA
jgi:hypothetical protein